jgi:hypothetical protein
MSDRVFVILHPHPDWSGYFGGVDFYQGKGSTSSLEDAARLVGLGCTIDGDESWKELEAFILARMEQEDRIRIPGTTRTMRRADLAFRRKWEA